MSKPTGETGHFEVVGETPWDELERMLREVPLLNQPGTRPYADATMSIERFRLSELSSTTRYVQKDLVAVQGLIRASLLPQGFDQLDLRDGGLVIDGDQGPQRIIPPMVERYEEEGEAKYIIDGSHRAQLARQVGEQEGIDDPELTVVYVRDGIAYPPYALTNPWEEVQLVEERPADKSLWKNYRDFDKRYDLYRDYSEIYASAPRGMDSNGQ
jgi:hypothetical protein